VPLIGVLSAGPTLGTNGLVYAVGRPGETLLFAWEASTGNLRWATNLGEFASDHPGSLVIGPEEHVYIRKTSGVSAVDGKTGAKLWSSQADGAITVGGDGTVYVAGDALYALEPATGATRWSSPFGFGTDSGPPALSANGLLVVPTDPLDYGAQAITTFDAHNGTQVWKFTPGSTSLAFFTSAAIAADGTVFASGRNGHVFALDGSTGQKTWSFQGPGEAFDLIITPDGLVCVAFNDGSHALIQVRDGQTMELQREWHLPYAQKPRLALTADGTLYVAPYEFLGAGGPQLLALDMATGQTNWVFDSEGHQVRSLNVGSDGTVYFESGFLYAIHGSSPLADGPWPKAQQNSQNSSFWNVSGPPQITKQPRSQWAALDRSTAFHFYAPVARPLHIQWQFNGQPIAGATNESLRIESVRFSDAGKYSVSFSNALGGVLSDEATLSVGYALDVTTLGPGIVRRTPDLDVYPTNSVVELRAVTTRSNHTFLGWSGDVSSAEETITLAFDRNHDVTATFEYLYPDVKWISYFGDAPALSANGILYAHTGPAVVALDMATGSNIWEVVSGDGWWASPALGPDGTVYIGDYGGSSIWALDANTGENRGGFNVGICVHACPTISVDGTLYLAGAKLFAVDPVSFTEKWSFEGGDIFESSPALSADGVLFAGSYDGKMYALNGVTGTKLWEFTTGGGIHSSPALGADGTVYFGSGDGRLYALDGLKGQKRWDFSSGGPISGSPVIGPDGTIYFGSEDNNVYALNQEGAFQWQFATGGRVTATPVLTADGTLYVGSQGGGLFALHGQTGKRLWQFEGASATPAIGPDGTVYSGGFALRGTSPLADSPWPKFHRDASNRGRLPGRPILERSQLRLTPGGFALTIHSEAGDTLTIETSVDLVSWTPLETRWNGTGRLEFIDSTAAGAGQRFYRAFRVGN